MPTDVSSATPVPSELWGCWQRVWIEFADGIRDDTSFVVWLQLPSLMADVRLSAAALSIVDDVVPDGFGDCSLEQLQVLAGSDSSAGATTCTPFITGADGVPRATAEWSSTVGFQAVSAFPEPGLLELHDDGTVMIERAPSGAYVEEWRLLPGTSGPLSCEALVGGATWYRAGDVGVLVHDRRLGGEALDCEFSFARLGDHGWVIEQSTLPWRVGTVIAPA
ncbi:MAG: hypothetical protein ABMA25_13595 [Ilumatobacteraceae bacterium]